MKDETKDAIFGWWEIDHTNILNVIGRRNMKAKSIIITPVLNGFLVKVGCQEVVFQSLGYLVQEIERYYKNPVEVEKGYLNLAVIGYQAERAQVVGELLHVQAR